MRHMPHTTKARQNRDLVLPDLKRAPRNLHFVIIHTVDHEFAAFADEINSGFKHGGRASSFDDDVKPVSAGCLQGVQVGLRPVVRYRYIRVRDAQLLREIQLWPGFASDSQVGSPIEADELSEENASGSAAEQEYSAADFDLHSLDAVRGACGGLDEYGFQSGEGARGVQLAGGIPTVFCESAGDVAAECCEGFAE